MVRITFNVFITNFFVIALTTAGAVLLPTHPHEDGPSLDNHFLHSDVFSTSWGNSADEACNWNYQAVLNRMHGQIDINQIDKVIPRCTVKKEMRAVIAHQNPDAYQKISWIVVCQCSSIITLKDSLTVYTNVAPENLFLAKVKEMEAYFLMEPIITSYKIADYVEFVEQ